jgi:prepilin-type N-terminal cleavage/methylation domain-containing protein/prepilin-type processing-associated H-X9-DG protein
MKKRKGFIPLERTASVSNKFLSEHSIPTKKKLKRYRFLMGFTLIEVLVVISIIVLLMAILIPSLTKARKSAMSVVCQSNLKQWGTIFTMFTNDNEGRFIHDFGLALWFIRGAQLEQGDPNIPPNISTYINAKGIGCCPLATESSEKPSDFPPNPITPGNFGDYTIYGYFGSTFEAWQIIKPEPKFCGSYGFNGHLLDGYFYTIPKGLYPSGRRVGLDIYNIKESYIVPAFLDCSSPVGSVRAANILETEPTRRFLINRHDGRLNCLFLDWSVRKVGLKELFTLKWSEDFNRANKWTIAGGAQQQDWPEWMRGFKDY